ncbi:uncharacterized protein LOC134227340 [Armigeres subalbatus]|uniref:uncharacterized protein LOC134227340 n=1 Tax=Armigeres subalbatus TaxID=124917 RepID=UPI002ED45F77
MGFKLKWFRRRITFEGIPSAPERSIRRKEQTTSVTAVGVYRQSVNFEDYIEPSRASYGEPPSHPFVTTRIRKPNTSTTSSATVNKSSEKNSPRDKIARERNNGRFMETPPEPSYSPPKPPMRRGISMTKSTPNISTLESPKAERVQMRALEATRSIEVLNEVPVETRKDVPVATTSRAEKIDYDVPAFETVNSGKASQANESEQMEHWKHQQPQFFSEILEKVNEFGNNKNAAKTEDGYGSETESYEEVFEKVKAKPRLPTDNAVPPKPDPSYGNFYERDLSRHTSCSSIDDVFEPRPPEYIFTLSMEEEPNHNGTSLPEVAAPRIPEPEPRNLMETIPQPNTSSDTSPKPLKSILKKRAPAPPTQQTQPIEVITIQAEIPTPPPRAIHKQRPPSPKVSEEEDDDGYLNWNMVERHRSSITHTMATQRLDPEIIRNVPASLQQPKPLLNARAILDEESPKTLRGMRSKQSAPASNGNTFLAFQGNGAARNSESNLSEASA